MARASKLRLTIDTDEAAGALGRILAVAERRKEVPMFHHDDADLWAWLGEIEDIARAALSRAELKGD